MANGRATDCQCKTPCRADLGWVVDGEPYCYVHNTPAVTTRVAQGVNTCPHNLPPLQFDRRDVLLPPAQRRVWRPCVLGEEGGQGAERDGFRLTESAVAAAPLAVGVGALALGVGAATGWLPGVAHAGAALQQHLPSWTELAARARAQAPQILDDDAAPAAQERNNPRKVRYLAPGEQPRADEVAGTMPRQGWYNYVRTGVASASNVADQFRQTVAQGRKILGLPHEPAHLYYQRYVPPTSTPATFAEAATPTATTTTTTTAGVAEDSPPTTASADVLHAADAHRQVGPLLHWLVAAGYWHPPSPFPTDPIQFLNNVAEVLPAPLRRSLREASIPIGQTPAWSRTKAAAELRKIASTLQNPTAQRLVHELARGKGHVTSSDLLRVVRGSDADYLWPLVQSMYDIIAGALDFLHQQKKKK